MQSLAPGKKIIALIIICLIVVGGSLYFSSRNTATYTLNSVENQSGKSVFDKDSDEDGIPDWEEVLWGTDPFNPDTDGSGVGDKEKIERMKADGSENLAVFENTSQVRASGNVTKTDQIAQQLLADLINIKNSPNSVNSTPSDLANRVANEISAQPGAQNIYRVEDVRTLPGRVDPDVVMAYTNSLISVLSKYQKSPVNINTLGINDTSDPAFKTWAQGLADYYLKISEDILAIPVQSELINFHLAIANGFGKNSDEFKIVTNADEDVVPALSAVERINNLHMEINYLFTYLEYYLSTNDIILSESQGIYIRKP